MTQKKGWILVPILMVIALFAWRWLGRSTSKADDSAHSAGTGAVTAAVARVERRTIANTLKIAGEFKPFQEVDVHAKVAGYVRTIYVDVGDHVKEGQTLAVLEIPELAAELAGADAAVRRSEEEIRRAEGDLARAESAHSAAHSGYVRLKQAAEARAGLVAQQEIDDSQAKDLESEAQVASSHAALSSAQQQLQVAQANQRHFSALSNYARITAPFAAVITRRFADTGALIQAGTASNTQAMPLVRLAQASRLRLVLPIPESLAAQIHLGNSVKVQVQALNREFEGKVSRFADSLDRQTRTMETEIDFDNRNGQLIPGMYAETQLSLSEKKDALTIPVEAVARNGDEATVLAVTPRNLVEERHVKLGLEDGPRVEVLSGVTENERVIIGSHAEFRNGQTVFPKEAGRSADKGAGDR